MFKIPFESDSLQFSDSLNVDTKLQLSCESLVDEIRKNIKTEKVPKVERLRKIKEFPTSSILSTLAWKVYVDGEKVPLPDGWKLLTTATNKEITNGYFGAAFLHTESLHMVVAHRGTELDNLGAVVADIAGIVFNNCGGQMESACTFADAVAESMKTIEKENDEANFELFFTGHR